MIHTLLICTSPGGTTHVEQRPDHLANQHFVRTPGWNGVLETTSVYARSPEEAVAGTRALFTEADEIAKVDEIRLAVGDELPWAVRDTDWVVEIRGHGEVDGHEFLSEGMSEEEVRDIYQNIASLRRPTPAEKEESVRARILDDDQVGEMEFERGFEMAKEADLY